MRPEAYTDSQLSLPNGTKKTEGVVTKTKNKHIDGQKKWSGHEVRGVSQSLGPEGSLWWERLLKDVGGFNKNLSTDPWSKDPLGPTSGNYHATTPLT